MARCSCKTLQGVQCKKPALKGSKMCSIHKSKKCGAKQKKAPSKSPKWVKSKAWESPDPFWIKGVSKDKTKVMSPQNADPWWLR